MSDYAELAVTSNFSFLRGASHPQDFLKTAIELGHKGVGIADRNTVAGVVRAYSAFNKARAQYAQAYGADTPMPFKFVVGSRLVFNDGTPDILAYPQDRAGWAHLCRLLSLGKLKAEKAGCILRLVDLLNHCDGLSLIVMPSQVNPQLSALLQCLNHARPGGVWLAAGFYFQGDDRARLARLNALAQATGTPLIAVNDVLYHNADQRSLQDVVSCIREGVALASAGRLLHANAERHLKSPDEMARLFRDMPEALGAIDDFLGCIEFSLDQITYQYPEEPVPPGRTPQAWLEELTWRRAAWRYPQGIPAKVVKILNEELALIAQLDYARYFLTIHDIVRYAEDQGILCQGRGSAANSAVCYALGITAVDPSEHDLLFARFISVERKEPPDIDVDFEHERREEVIQHIYQRYGRDRAGIAATVITYRSRSAIREVGKVFGLTEDITSRLASTVWGSWSKSQSDLRVREAGLDPGNKLIEQVVAMTGRLIGFPRHLSQHVGGFVLTRSRLDEIVPIGNAAMDDRTFIEWDKDDIDELGLMKVDVLALGMLTCIRKCFDLIRTHAGRNYDLATLPQEDPAVYKMLQKGDSIGVFQVESRAQINMLPRLRPKEFYDLVIQVAIVRPGPIQGDMVHPYLRRRNHEEAEIYPSPAPPHDPNELHQVLHRTLGVPLFQEQAMKIAMVAAEFSADEANGLRRAMATFRHLGTMSEFEGKMVDGMVRRGYDPEFAQRCFNQIKGFGEYGFPESHAASFAKLVYVSAWLKHHYPAVFACGLLNAQPMGFYAPAQIVRDAREHGVEVRPIDINASQWDNIIEIGADGAMILRLGMRQIDGFKKSWAADIMRLRTAKFDSVESLWRKTGLPKHGLKLLADADGLGSINLDRRAGLWAIRRLPDDNPLPLFAAADARELGDEPFTDLPQMPLSEHVVADYQTTRLSLKAHPMAFLRGKFGKENILSCGDLANQADGAHVRVAGVVLIRQRPGKGNAIFMTLEDETGIANALIWARRFERYRRAIMGAKLMLIEGKVQKSAEGVIHLMAQAVYDRTYELDALTNTQSTARTLYRPTHPRNVRVIPNSRDFH
ncbi:error-prone DNA polymerase [Devosia rhodophyticola]|uniref:Error-prone DNA polymerase n=1 Tax=Devosia rhodophyticola TaxID=3026423 RepID=A0ABY7YUB7_9HYPH|nr:error-prone DNA polymerase [Devosia rhodophyticola]WDR04792.1 error-prone DNA polymerase [Devosia rhodophyticola]